MKITYEKHYNYLIDKYGRDEGMKKYKSFLRSSSLETYIIKYGEEEGKKKFNKKKKPGSSLEKMIEKYGEEEGKKKYDKWKKLTNQSESSFIDRYGEEEGKKKYDEFRLNCVVKNYIKNDNKSKYNNRKHSTRVEYYLEKCEGDYEKAKKMLSERQNTSSKDKFIEKYGLCEGLKKYHKTNKLKSITLENFIRLYGDIVGSERWENYKNRLKYSRTKGFYVEKYGVEGIKIWEDIQKKKLHNFIFRSKISDEFCFNLFKLLKNDIKSRYYFSENEYMFFVHDENYKIILPDFFIKDFNIIVEFYGDYWHRNPKIYKDDISEKIRNNDYNRIKKLRDLKNHVIIVWESEYLSDKNKTIKNIYNKIKKIISENGNN